MKARTNSIFFLLIFVLICLFLNQKDPNEFIQINDPKFIFLPSAQSRPCGSKAIFTFLAPPMNLTEQPNYYFINVLALAHKLLHHPLTKITSPNTEFVVLSSKTLPEGMQTSLLMMGARLILADHIQLPGALAANPNWSDCFTKLYMFALQGIYDQIVYYDADMTILRNPEGLFDYFPKTTNSTYFFGAARDVGLDASKFNAGMMAIVPSLHHYRQIMKFSTHIRSYDAAFMEQGLLNWYFSTAGPSRIRWRKLPYRYNAQWLNHQPSSILESSKVVAMHGKFWWETGFPDMVVYTHWLEGLQELRSFQLTHFGETDVTL